jgi:hypothetical protein
MKKHEWLNVKHHAFFDSVLNECHWLASYVNWTDTKEKTRETKMGSKISLDMVYNKQTAVVQHHGECVVIYAPVYCTLNV